MLKVDYVSVLADFIELVELKWRLCGRGMADKVKQRKGSKVYTSELAESFAQAVNAAARQVCKEKPADSLERVAKTKR
ncbi:hypothetical protein R7Q10_19130 [Vibrio sp. Vb0599]|uniref:hypothetical protein n=1 Tax=Vibrio sp. Vb0599 TaxID=3074628 RepID=UPI002964BC70|nr:hypothetical protein [Vibrio sp. Vb0599]MDW1944138.1 hypothetical protein [Vibrio sp. Vb0599]